MDVSARGSALMDPAFQQTFSPMPRFPSGDVRLERVVIYLKQEENPAGVFSL
jgi:hypothetical protein